jgi:hypothetical protein
MFAYVCHCEIVAMAFARKKLLAALLEEDLTHTLHFSHYECSLDSDYSNSDSK